MEKPEFVTYEHHDVEVVGMSHLAGRHRQRCLCYWCERFKDNLTAGRDFVGCQIANKLFALCKKANIVTPVGECPHFVESPDAPLVEIPD